MYLWKNLHLPSIRIDLYIPNIVLFDWNKFRTRCCSTNSPCIPRNANLTRFLFIRLNERNRVEEKVQFRKVYPKWRNYAWGRMPARLWGFPRNLASWGTNIVLTGPPGSYSYAAGSIADCRNTLPLAFNVQLGDYSSLEAGQKSRSKPRFRSVRRSTLPNIGGRDIKYYMDEKLQINCYDNEDDIICRATHLQSYH